MIGGVGGNKTTTSKTGSTTTKNKQTNKELQEVLKQSQQSWLLKRFQGLGFNRMSFSFPLIIYLKSQVELFMNKS